MDYKRDLIADSKATSVGQINSTSRSRLASALLRKPAPGAESNYEPQPKQNPVKPLLKIVLDIYSHMGIY